MQRKTCLLLGVALLILAGLAAHTLPTLAQQPQAAYDLSWWTVDGGGYTFSTGGGYSLGGTIGQPDAGLLQGGGYTLGGGFWRGAAAAVYRIYLPVVLRGF